MEYEDEIVEDTLQQATEAGVEELEAFLKSLTATPVKQRSPQEKVAIRRRVEDVLFEKSYHNRYGDPFGEL
jgi:isocitrate dehydrogenase